MPNVKHTESRAKRRITCRVSRQIASDTTRVVGTRQYIAVVE
jgi:hypothetical protein